MRSACALRPQASAQAESGAPIWALVSAHRLL